MAKREQSTLDHLLQFSRLLHLFDHVESTAELSLDDQLRERRPLVELFEFCFAKQDSEGTKRHTQKTKGSARLFSLVKSPGRGFERTLSNPFVSENVERRVLDLFAIEDSDNLLRETASVKCKNSRCVEQRQPVWKILNFLDGYETDLGVSRSPFMNKTTSLCFINS